MIKAAEVCSQWASTKSENFILVSRVVVSRFVVGCFMACFYFFKVSLHNKKQTKS